MMNADAEQNEELTPIIIECPLCKNSFLTEITAPKKKRRVVRRRKRH